MYVFSHFLMASDVKNDFCIDCYKIFGTTKEILVHISHLSKYTLRPCIRSNLAGQEV